ncbi:phage tail protein [Flammeovirga pacifica]|uniref:phage tail protein n=1 Tax=Flammeovirga pacifica TaxID=915059 RepID=UPI0018FE1BFE|nr:phage tail protein [Flammeovirga pacifica]
MKTLQGSENEIDVMNQRLTYNVGFQSISGIESGIKTKEIKYGGQNASVFMVPDGRIVQKATFKRGMVTLGNSLIDDFSSWIAQHLLLSTQSRLNRTVTTRNLMVGYLNGQQEPVKVWGLYNAYPISWKLSEMNAMESKIAVEEIVLTYSHVLGIT